MSKPTPKEVRGLHIVYEKDNPQSLIGCGVTLEDAVGDALHNQMERIQ